MICYVVDMDTERERTTIRMEKALLDDARRHAAETGTTFTELVDQAVRSLLAMADHQAALVPQPRVRWKPLIAGGPLPGVDLEDKDSLYEDDLKYGPGADAAS